MSPVLRSNYGQQLAVYHGDSVLYPYSSEYDHVICDPPYSAHVHKSAATMRGGAARSNEFDFAHLSPLLRASISQRVALAKSWSLIFCDWEGLGAWKRDIEDSGAQYIRALPWVRWSMPQLSGKHPSQGSECVILAHPGGAKQRWSGPGNLTHFDTKCLRAKDKHKAEKPLELMMLLIEYFTQPDSLIIDPTMGHGTTLVAAKALGRRAHGIEGIEAWVDRAIVRLSGSNDAQSISNATAKIEKVRVDIARMQAYTAKVLRVRAAKDVGGEGK